ncbi:MAG: hypothetical protein HKO59_05330 [Phycisphaerales bacterium]|nr:hypothetical protein [Phycisphaerales bacterium]
MRRIHQFVHQFVLALPLLCVATAAGQAINIDFGLPGAGPPDTYAAAGRAGVWNSIEGEETPFWDPRIIYELVDVDGNATGVTLYQFGGTELIAADDPALDGPDAVFLNDAIVTHTLGLETCLWINGLANGTYEVLTYAWMPEHPESRARVRHDFQPVTVDVGGPWPDGHVEGVTYARHVIEVTSGFIGSHSGNVAGADLLVGAALNGMQLRPIVDCPADLDGSGGVGFTDLLSILAAWGPCAACPQDLDGSGDVGFTDLLTVLSAWGPCV